ncbi:selenite/tellurite reduction operon rhodanese-like protein ExtH [uncultured Desulfuromonas sp.]|uniref:selenite/tellurite reduction operon rhodanese-like protein ExtH n=1 Tax=uncultured Desulfuromonas sp. TaxID=181013 RepID=UPI002AAACC94|nr:selenite/tellurite reduction operon rhodanese-like protein ExtH [uncultured Desulfuromonas sp.]
MIRKVFNHTSRNFSLFAVILLSTFVLTACGGGGGGSDSYDQPDTPTNDPVNGSASSVLIEADTLKQWLDEGLVNNTDSYDGKVVILEYGTTGDRIPGAIQVGVNELRGTRLDGLAPAASLVATGPQIDAVIQAAGIDENTTVVLMTGGKAYLSTRPYWTFRYWGFSQDRLKVLNGGKTAWTAAGYDLTSEETVVAPSTYSVKDIGAINDDLRVSIGELIETLDDATIANGTDYITIDARGGSATSGFVGAGTTTSLISGSVVFEGHPAGGIAFSQGALFDADGKFLDADTIKGLLETAGWQEGMPVITYCTSGFSCTPIFFAFEAILGTEVQVFDGSWSQAGQYAAIGTDADMDGVDDNTGAVLPSDSPWDLSFFVDDLAYNADDADKTVADIYTMPYSADLESWYNPGDEETDQVETTDSSYVTSGSSDDGDAPSAGGDSGSVGC